MHGHGLQLGRSAATSQLGKFVDPRYPMVGARKQGGRAAATRAQGRRVMQDAMHDIMAAAREACSAEAYASGLSTLSHGEVILRRRGQ